MRTLCLTLVLALAPTALNAAPVTTVVRYAPFGPGGVRSGFVITARVRGYCWNTSLASPRGDAWRCMVGNEIYDPCLSNAAHSAVACPEDAFSKRLTLITLTKPLPAPVGDAGTAPWGLVLTNGLRCTMTTGATDAVDGMRLNYACGKGGWVLGEVDRSAQPWEVHYSPRIDGKHYTTVSVREAVF